MTTPNSTSPVRMTHSAAREAFRSASAITAGSLTEHHIGMVGMMALDIETRAALGDAEDDIAAGRIGTAAVAQVAAAYNSFVGR